MKRHELPSILVACVLAGACAGDRDAAATTLPSADESAQETLEEPRVSLRPRVELKQALHHADMTEVVLDARGHGALTLDSEGNVRLWPDLVAEHGIEPFSIPVQEPVWMSLARKADGGFVAGFIDTAGGARVGHIDIAGGRASWSPAFVVPPTEPLFELHVLDGGERIVALAVDHRLHLWDADGVTLSRLDEVGFVPWQLRVPPEKETTVLAVLADPVRLQAISLANDRIARVGEPIPVTLDRGPNRNDLTLTPDGTTALVLQQPRARGKRFELELIDVRSGERRIIAAESDLGHRPRVHPLDGRRVLLESGSGNGFWVDLDKATIWSPENDELDRAAVETQSVMPFTLQASTRETMLHSVVVAGRRVVPTTQGLVVAGLQGEDHRVLERRAFRPLSVAIDAQGHRVAWGTQGGIMLESVEGESSLRTLEGTDDSMELLAFLGDDALVTLGAGGRASILSVADGHLVATQKIAFDWGIANTAWRPLANEDGGALVLASTKPSAPLQVVDVSQGTFVEVRQIPHEQRSAWPEAGKPRRMKSRDWLEQIGVAIPEGQLRAAEVMRTEPDPTGRLIAITQMTAHNAGFDESLQEWVEGPHDFVITIYDRKTAQRLWTHAAPGFTDLAWSGDGRRLAVTDTAAGYVLEAATGQTLHERRDLGL
jgi:hypothetical protein